MVALVAMSAVLFAQLPAEAVVSRCASLDGWSAAPWPDRGGAAPTSRVQISVANAGPGHETALRIRYAFPSQQCTQVRIDFAIPPCADYAQLSFWLRGDGSGNVLEVWTGEQARGWHGAGHVRLDFTDWRRITLPLDDNFTSLTHTLRFIVRQAGGLGQHEIFLDDITLARPVKKSLPPDFSIGPRLPGPPPFTARKPFRLQRRMVGDKAVLLIDGEPVMCVLDALPSPDYLRLARRAGANCLAIDLYWRDLEPIEGFSNWQRLRNFIRWLGQAGFSVAMLVNIHQPRWLLARCPDEPLQHGCIYPNCPEVRRGFERFLRRFLKSFADLPNLIIVGVSGGGEASCSFPEIPGTLTSWRRSPWLLADFRAFLRAKYRTDAAWRKAWGLSGNQRISAAKPPKPLGGPSDSWTDFRRSWHDWREFADGWWLQVAEWQARLVKQLLPGRLVMVRFGWPVFQCFNPFLIRRARYVDMIQCQDAVPTWEQATPWFLVSRTALFHGAVRTTPKINFPEVDVGHNRGRPSSDDMRKFLPPLAPFIGALWYYRGLDESFVPGLSDAFAALKAGCLRPYSPKVAIFYGQRYANWTQNHTNYSNEAALAGAARLLGTAGLPFTVVSDYTLDDLRGMKVLVLADNPILPRQAARRISQFSAAGGAIVLEDLQRRDLSGHPISLTLPGPTLHIPGGFFASIQPRGGGIQELSRRSALADNILGFISHHLAD